MTHGPAPRLRRRGTILPELDGRTLPPGVLKEVTLPVPWPLKWLGRGVVLFVPMVTLIAFGGVYGWPAVAVLLAVVVFLVLWMASRPWRVRLRGRRTEA